MKKIFLFLFLSSIIGQNLKAQESSEKGKITFFDKFPTKLFIGGGISSPSSSVKKSASLSNFTDLNLGVYIPVKSFGKWSFGIEGGGNYSFSSADNCPSVTPFQIIGQANPPIITQKESDSSKNTGFRIGAGPAISWNISENFSLMPSFNVVYSSFKESKCTVSQTSQVNGIDYNWELCDQTTKASSGIGVLPKLKFIYQFGRIGLWVEGNYLMAQKLETVTKTFSPEGNTHQNGMYDLGQMNAGTYSTKTESKSYSSFGILGGISIGLGKPKNGLQTNDSKPQKNSSAIVPEEEKMPANIQKLIDEQDSKLNQYFQNANINSKKTSTDSKCNFTIEESKGKIECNGKDANGNKKYKVTLYYKNLSATGTSRLGSINGCIANTNNGNYLFATTSGTATITNLSPAASTLTTVAPGASQVVTFDLVVLPGFTTLTILGNTINSTLDCGNCINGIVLNIPNCCDGCEVNKVSANSVSATSNADGSIDIVNSISSTSSSGIVRIEADLASVRTTPNNSDCQKCNNEIKYQNNFIDKNQIFGSGWANSGNPSQYLGENNVANTSRSLVFSSTNSNGITMTNPINIIQTVGVAPASCCGDTVEIWIRYTVWDKDCKVCDKLVKSTITRAPACNTGNGNGGTTGTSLPNGSVININNTKN